MSRMRGYWECAKRVFTTPIDGDVAVAAVVRGCAVGAAVYMVLTAASVTQLSPAKEAAPRNDRRKQTEFEICLARHHVPSMSEPYYITRDEQGGYELYSHYIAKDADNHTYTGADIYAAAGEVFHYDSASAGNGLLTREKRVTVLDEVQKAISGAVAACNHS